MHLSSTRPNDVENGFSTSSSCDQPRRVSHPVRAVLLGCFYKAKPCIGTSNSEFFLVSWSLPWCWMGVWLWLVVKVVRDLLRARFCCARSSPCSAHRRLFKGASLCHPRLCTSPHRSSIDFAHDVTRTDYVIRTFIQRSMSKEVLCHFLTQDC